MSDGYICPGSATLPSRASPAQCRRLLITDRRLDPERVEPDRIWTALNLRTSPFRSWPPENGPRGEGVGAVGGFVGRRAEADALFNAILSATSSRQVIQGGAGTGRRALSEHVKARARAEGYLTGSGAVAIAVRQSADELLVALLRHVHDALLARAPSLVRGNRAMDRARGLIQHQRRKEITALTLGLRDGEPDPRSKKVRRAVLTPPEAVPELLEALLDVAREHVPGAAKGVIIPLVGMEELRGFELRASLRVVRDTREALLVEGYHFLLVSAPDTLRSFRRREPWAAGLFSDGVRLDPLAGDEVEALLERRYDALRLDPCAPVRRPVPPGAGRALSRLFEGDLHALMRALERLATELARGHEDEGPEGIGEPVDILSSIYRAEAELLLTQAELACLERLRPVEDGLFRQAQLEEIWELKQSRVSDIVSTLTRARYLRKGDHEGRTILYGLTGPGRLALRAG